MRAGFGRTGGFIGAGGRHTDGYATSRGRKDADGKLIMVLGKGANRLIPVALKAFT